MDKFEENLKRFNELKNMEGQLVWYNDETYKVVGYGEMLDVGDRKLTVYLQPTKTLIISGEDILNIKNIATKLIHKKDGSFEFIKVPYNGEEKNSDGFIEVYE